MKKILFSIYTEGYPNKNTGGPNHIIYEIVNHNKSGKFKIDFLSYDTYINNLDTNKINEITNPIYFKKKITNLLFENFSLYRNIVSSDLYLPAHFKKKEKRFKRLKKISTNYDIIHSQDSLSLAYLTQIHSNKKKILTIHSKGPLSDELKNMVSGDKLKNRVDVRLKKYELKSIELADVITFPSRAARTYFENSMEIELDNTKVKIVYNGIDFNRIHNISGTEEILEKYLIEKTKDRLILLNIAAHTSEKNIDILLKVIEKLLLKYKKDVLLLNIGEGNLTNELRVLTNKLKIQNNVRFLGKLPNEDVIKLLKATDIFIMSSGKVIFDIVVLEALACSTCCVVSNEGGNKEIIKDCENGYLIDIDDVDKIAQKIISVDIDKVKTKAIETAKQFSVQKMVDEYFELYESLLDGV